MPDQNILKKREFAVRLTFLIGVALLVIKFYAWFITDSSAIYSDALESIVNVITAITGWVAIRISARPADKDHPYGHGKVEYFSAGLEGFLIAIAGAAIIYEGIRSLIAGVELQYLSTGISLIFATAIINGSLSFYLIKTGKKTRSATLTASAYHVGVDALTSIVVLLGLLLVQWTGKVWIDSVLAFLVAFHIIFQGFRLLNASIMRLMDSADSSAIGTISDALIKNRRDEWIAPHRLRAWRSGAQLFVDFHLIMPWFLTLKETHELEHEIKTIFTDAMQEPVEMIIHAEPCFPQACSYCRMKNCAYRSSPQEIDLVWDKENLMSVPAMPKPEKTLE